MSTPKIYRACPVAKAMVTERRRYAPRRIENKRRKAQLSPKYRVLE